MKHLFTFSLAIFAFISSAHSQFTENFNDGDFTANPPWVGNTADFIVNPAFELQSNNTVANANFYLSTASTKATVAQWDLYIRLPFSTSSTNYVDVFLTANASNVFATSTTGYFVRIGGTTDEISLYRKDNGSITKIIDGLDGALGSNNTIKLRVVRNAANQFQLFRDLSGTGSTYFSEGTSTDATYLSSAFFGIGVKQSTASFFQKHFFDDIEVKNFVPDVTPPVIVSATATNATTVDVLFNEAVELPTSQQAANYSVSSGIGMPVTAVRDAINTSLVHLTFGTALPIRTNLTLTVNGVKDLAGNTLTNGSTVFSYFVAIAYDVIIDELMADPTPLVGLPDREWLELRNTSAFTINLEGWRVGKAGSPSGAMPVYLLKPDSAIIICSSSAVADLTAFGPVISVTSFPSLNNTSDDIFLQGKSGRIIHNVSYTDAWYQNELKKDGGWSLEMVDIKNPCSGMSNWRASVDPKGGTPGKINSVNGTNPDNVSPKLTRAFAVDATHITLVYNENVDSTSGAKISNYAINNGIGAPVAAVTNGPAFNTVTLTLATALQSGTIYTITATGVADCVGNAVSSSANTALVGTFGNLLPFDVVVNEILFNPKSGEEDYIEIYNRSKKVINLKNTFLANRNTAGVVSSITQLTTTDYAFFPEQFIVLTKTASSVTRNFLAPNAQFIIEMSTPSYSDDKGNVIILNEQGAIVDEISYDDKWHFALINNTEGVALERIDYNDTSLIAATQQKNWHSAASSVGFGTPTYKNSQYKINEDVQGEIKVTPEIVSPDNDGMDDFATINYTFPSPGYVSNITIFDAQGRPVRYLQRNALNGIKGYYRWDGLGENNKQLPVGLYIIYTEVFDLTGKTKKFKNTIVLARRGG